MPYKYEAASSHQPPRRTPSAQTLPHSTYSYQAYVAPKNPTFTPAKASTLPPIQQHRSATHIPKIRVFPGTPTTQETKISNPAGYSSTHLSPSRPATRSNTPTSQTSKSSKSSSSLHAPSLSYSSESEQGDASSLPRTPELASVIPPAVQIVFPSELDNSKSSRNSPPPSLQPQHTAYSAIEDIVYELNCCTISFQRPLDLDFETGSFNNGAPPRLAYTSKNRPLIEQNQRLERLQDKLDAIKSHGDRDVRRARKQAGAQVVRALEDLKWIQNTIWSKVSGPFSYILSKTTMLTYPLVLLEIT